MSETNLMPAAMKEKIEVIVKSLELLMKEALEKNSDDDNVKPIGKAVREAKALVATLVADKTTLDEFGKVAKAMPALVKSAKDASAKVKAAPKVKEVEAPVGKIIYSSKAVEKACNDSETKKKIASVLAAGSSYRGTPTPYLKASHDHVTNKTAIGYQWMNSGDLKIVAYGTKPASKSISGDGGYSWVQ